MKSPNISNRNFAPTTNYVLLEKALETWADQNFWNIIFVLFVM